MNWKLFGLVLFTVAAGHTPAHAQEEKCDGCFAIVQGDGTVQTSFGTTSLTTRGSEGRYLVRFERSVFECAYNATIGSYGNQDPPPGDITVRYEGNKRVRVNTYNTNGVPKDRPFHLSIVCPEAPF